MELSPERQAEEDYKATVRARLAKLADDHAEYRMAGWTALADRVARIHNGLIEETGVFALRIG